jgi:hypothetical protein
MIPTLLLWHFAPVIVLGIIRDDASYGQGIFSQGSHEVSTRKYLRESCHPHQSNIAAFREAKTCQEAFLAL